MRETVVDAQQQATAAWIDYLKFARIKELTDRLSAEERKFIDLLDGEYRKFNSLADLAFDTNVNIAFAGSIQMAEFIGVEDGRILKTKETADRYFTI